MSSRLTPPAGPKDHSQGPADAPITLVEYGDYECPHCGRAHPIVKAVQRRLGDQLRFVFRHFPLSAAHPDAEPAAETAEMAADQGKFWEMHELLYGNQDALEPEDLVGYAERLGLDPKWAAEALRQHTYGERVRASFLSGVRSGVNGTPTFFINGIRHDGAWDEESLLEAIRSAAYAAAQR
jgi:protein-disulfide isomerase